MDKHRERIKAIEVIAKKLVCVNCEYEFAPANITPCAQCRRNPLHKDYYRVKDGIQKD